MEDKLYRIKSLERAKGEIAFVSLDFMLAYRGYSPSLYKLSDLQTNAEIMNYMNNGYINFVEESEYQRLRKEEEKARAAAHPITVEDALEQDSPARSELEKRLNATKQALAALEALILNQDVLVKSKPTKVSGQTQAQNQAQVAPESLDDGLDLPVNAPTGYQPQPKTMEYLRKSQVDKKAFLKTCRDLGILRDVAMFEPDAKLKAKIRKFIKKTETEIEEATNMSQVV